MRVELADAVILHRRNYRDTSLLVEAFTREHGRVGLVARGARAARSRWRGALEPLQHLQLSWTGRGELHTLTHLDVVDTPVPAAGVALYAGFYAAELLLRLVARDDAYPGLFVALLRLWQQLAGAATLAPSLRVFEYRLLCELGYAPPLLHESDNGHAVAVEQDYLYHVENGLRLARTTATAAEVRVPGAALLALAAGHLESPADERGARRLLNAALAHQLDGRPLKTAQTLHAMQKMRDTT